MPRSLHAELEQIGGFWTVVDDGLSRNGTFVNGEANGPVGLVAPLLGRLLARDSARDEAQLKALMEAAGARGEGARSHALMGGGATVATSSVPSRSDPRQPRW